MNPPMTPLARALLWVVVAAWFALVLSSMACSGAQRASTLHAAVVTLDTACTAARAYAHQHTDTLIDSAGSRADGEAKVAAFRARSDRVLTACLTAFRAVALVPDGGDQTAAAKVVGDATKQATDLVGAP